MFKNQRKKLIINPGFQYRLIGLFFLMSLVMSLCILIFSWKTYSSFTKKLDEKRTKMGLYTELVNEYINEEVTVFWVPEDVKITVIKRLSIFIAFLMMMVILFGIIISNRIAGPLYRLKQYFFSISNDLSVKKVSFRNYDEFQDLAESFNQCIQHINNKMDRVKNSQEKLVSNLEAVLPVIKEEEARKKILEIVDQYKTAKNE